MEKYLRQIIRSLIREGTFKTALGSDVDYGSQEHIDDLTASLEDLIRVRDRHPRTSKDYYIYARSVEALRKQLRRARSAGLKAGLIEESNLRPLIRLMIEGGLKAPTLTGNVVLNPETVSKAVDVYTKILDMWNVHLQSKGFKPVKPVDAVGSVSRYEEDLAQDLDVTYGDVDYLVAIPVGIPDGASASEIRDLENKATRDYTQEMVDFLTSNSEVSSLVNVPATIKSSPMMLIVRLPNGDHVQVDTVVTYPHYLATPEGEGWMPWKSERGIKTYSIALLHTTLGKMLNLSISDRGVLARVRGEETVPFAQRKGTELVKVSGSFKTLFSDIARYLTKSEDFHPTLEENPGLDLNHLTIEDEARGIKGLLLTLSQYGIVGEPQQALNRFHTLYVKNLQDLIDKKKGRGLSEEKYEKLKEQNQAVADRVKRVFDE